MTMSCLPIQWRRRLILSAAVAFAACSSSSTTNDAQVAGGSGGTTSAGSGGASAHLDAAVASTGGSTDSGVGGSTTSGGGSTGTSNTGVDAAQADRPATGGTGGTGSTVDGAADWSGVDAPATDGTQADAPIRDSQGDSRSDSSDGAVDDGQVATSAILFVPDDLANTVYRYAITPTGDPVLGTTISASGANSVALGPTGELFVSNYSGGGIHRFLSACVAPVANGEITAAGLSRINQFGVEDMAFVDGELWATNPAKLEVVRLSFDSQGNASVAGTLSGLAQNAGIVWDPIGRIAYISLSFEGGDTIQPYRVASNHSTTQLATIKGNGLNGPDGMVITLWGELLVADYYAHTISRFSIDSEGNATSNGIISGNGLSNPAGLAIAPWGELFAANQGTGTLSRFTFDGQHAAVANGTFQTMCRSNPGGSGSGSRMGWIAIVPSTCTE